ncbi:hypothetical protein [Agathobacter rectalis]
MVSASDLGLANSKIVELGSFGSNGENISSSNRARTKNIYKTSEQAFKFESSKAAGMRYAVVGFDANGKRVLDSGWQTGATYILGKEVVSYRLLFSYTDNRTMTSADTLKIESSITFSAVETKSSVIEVGSFGTDGKNTVSSNRARTVNSYKVSEKTFKFESSKAAGMRYAVVGFDANGKRVLDSGWQTGATYILGKEVVSYRLLFSYTDNRTMTSADTLKIESSITFSAVETKSSVIEVGSFGTDGKNTVSSNRARTVNSYKVSEKTFKFESSKAAGMRYAVVGFDANGKRVLDSGWQTGATYTLGKEVVSYRLLFSYTDNRTMTSADTLKIESSITFSAVETKSSVIEVGSFGTDGKNTVSSNRARTVNSYKVSEKTFKFESSKAAGMRYAVVGFDANGKRVLDSGWQTGATYTLGKEVVSYRLLFSYTDNRTMTSADTLKIESSITFSAVETKSSVIEVGSFGTDGKNTVSSNRARTVNSYKVSEKTFKFESSKAAGMRYAVVGFDANGKRVLDSGWQTGATYTLGKEVVSYRLLFSYTDNRTMTVEDTLKIEKSLSIIPASAIDDWELPIM